MDTDIPTQNLTITQPNAQMNVSYAPLMTLLHREDPLINLNYCLLLFNNGDRSGAAKQFAQYQAKMRKQQGKQLELDPEVCVLGGGCSRTVLMYMTFVYTQMEEVSKKLAPIIQLDVEGHEEGEEENMATPEAAAASAREAMEVREAIRGRKESIIVKKTKVL